LSIVGAMIDIAAGIIELNISEKEETFTFKPKGTEQCNQVMVTIRLARNAMTPDKKPSATKNFSMKFSRCVKNATPVATSSPVAPVTKIFRCGDSLADRPKMRYSRRENKPVVISSFIFRPSSTVCIFDFYLSPFHPPFFLLLFHNMFISSLHNIKSKNFKSKVKELWKKMKGIGFAFDAFGQWSEKERNKMKWRMKAGIEWRSSMAGRPKIGGWPTTFSLVFSFPLHYLPL
jgi:hypothetical protein